ncbi:hypothetical protein D3C80_1042700 [compost metagenome]
MALCIAGAPDHFSIHDDAELSRLIAEGGDIDGAIPQSIRQPTKAECLGDSSPVCLALQVANGVSDLVEAFLRGLEAAQLVPAEAEVGEGLCGLLRDAGRRL